MKKGALALINAAVLAACITAGSVAHAQEYRLRWGHYLAQGPFLEVEEEFARKIEERTDGRVKIDITWAGGLGKGNEVFTLAGRGAIDMAASAPGYYPDQLLYWKKFQTPFVFDSPEEAMDVLAKVVEEFPVYKEEMDKMNLVWLFQQPLDPYYLTGPSAECNSVAALEGKKLRSFGADVPKVHAAIGAVPVSVGVVEVYEALQRGTIDYSFLNAGNIEQYKLYEPGKFSCGTIMAITGHNIVVGKPTWDRLPKDIQEIFLDQAKKTQQDYLEWLKDFQTRTVENIKAAGGEFIEFPEEELAKWKEAAPDLLGQWVEDMEGRGQGEMAQKVAARWRELTAD